MARRKIYTPPLFIGLNVSIQPNYITTKATYNTIRTYNSVKQKANESNLKNNSHNGKLSDKATKRLRNAVNWLVVSAKYKRVWSERDRKAFWFKVNFITLTIPKQPTQEPDESLVKTMLHNFLVYSQKYFYLKNYVWKMETHKDGRLHIHITSDTFIHYKKLNIIWNSTLQRNGLLQVYKDKYMGCTFEEYVSMQDTNYIRSENAYRRAYQAGVNSNWESPNTTDVHAVWKVSNIAAYITKYMAKDPTLSAKYKGRIWGCNNELSDKHKCSVFIEPDVCSEETRWLANQQIEYSKIESKPNSMGKVMHLADIYFMSENIWSGLARGKMKEAYNARRFEIRHNIFKPPPEYYWL